MIPNSEQRFKVVMLGEGEYTLINQYEEAAWVKLRS